MKKGEPPEPFSSLLATAAQPQARPKPSTASCAVVALESWGACNSKLRPGGTGHIQPGSPRDFASDVLKTDTDRASEESEDEASPSRSQSPSRNTGGLWVRPKLSWDPPGNLLQSLALHGDPQQVGLKGLGFVFDEEFSSIP